MRRFRKPWLCPGKILLHIHGCEIHWPTTEVRFVKSYNKNLVHQRWNLEIYVWDVDFQKAIANWCKSIGILWKKWLQNTELQHTHTHMQTHLRCASKPGGMAPNPSLPTTSHQPFPAATAAHPLWWQKLNLGEFPFPWSWKQVSNNIATTSLAFPKSQIDI